jgi:hypothetical protein
VSDQLAVGRSENSRLAFEAIVAHGLLGRAHLAIYRFIYANGPITRNKLDAALCPGKANPWPSRRLVEMERMKVLAVVGQDETGPHRMDVWDVTDRMPEGQPRRETLRATLRKLVLGLEEVVDSMELSWVTSDFRGRRLKELVGQLRQVAGTKKGKVKKQKQLDLVSVGESCECWEGCNDREGMRPCEHERLPAGGGPFDNSKAPGPCRCGADGPPWKHEKTCRYD